MVGIAVLSAGGGIVIGSRLKSPADAASERAAPVASLITVPVEMRQLVSTLIVSGETRYVEPTPVRLAGAVGASGGEQQVITRLPDLDAEVVEGALLFEISGRPVFAMRGELPMYRQLTPGSKGPDVLQLETSLQTLGFAPGTVDDLYDAGTEAALDAFYQSRGYASEGASATERQQLTDARKAVTDAEDAVRKANIDLDNGQSTVTPSERLEAQQAVETAQDAVPEAQTRAQRANDQAAANTATQTALRDTALLVARRAACDPRCRQRARSDQPRHRRGVHPGRDRSGPAAAQRARHRPHPGRAGGRRGRRQPAGRRRAGGRRGRQRAGRAGARTAAPHRPRQATGHHRAP